MNKKTTDKLEKQLAAKQAELKKVTDALEKQIEKIKNANKPKDITERVKSFNDILKIAKPTKEELAIINYNGKSDRIKFAGKIMKLALGAEVLNEGQFPKADGNQHRHYPWFDVSSGFVFYNTHYADSHANTSSASRLSLKSEKLAVHYGKILLKEHKEAITM